MSQALDENFMISGANPFGNDIMKIIGERMKSADTTVKNDGTPSDPRSQTSAEQKVHKFESEKVEKKIQPKLEKIEDEEAADQEVEEVEEVEENETENVDQEDASESDKEDAYKFEINGTEEVVPVTDLINSYKMNKEIEFQSKLLEKSVKTYNDEIKAIQEERNQSRKLLEDVALLYNQVLPKKPPQEYWNNLRRTNTTEYLAQQQEWKDMEDSLTAIRNQYHKIVADEQATKQKEIFATQVKARSEFVKAFPELRDERVFRRVDKEITEYANKEKFTENELKILIDERVLTVLYKAMQFDKLKSNKPRPINKTTQTMKSGSQTLPEENPGKKSVNVLSQRFLKSRDQDSAAALIDTLLK
jgi:hypothetical protein